MSTNKEVLQAMVWGIAASLFLSSTFIINSLISGSGGYWAWTATLRSLFLIPILGLVVFFTKQLRATLVAIRQHTWLFVKWGTIGFGCLYTLLAVASLWAPGWMVAATFQVNILAGILLAPLIYNDHRKLIPKRAMLISVLILLGVFIMQFEKLAQLGSVTSTLLSFFTVLVGAVLWPLGNRKLLVDLTHKRVHLNALQRVLGMSVGCLPLLLVLSVVGFANSGWPSVSQCEASFWSAIFSGFVGGVGFYQATQLVSKNTVVLAAIEATQVFEILFALIGEMVLKGTNFPGFYAQLGLLIVFFGISLHFINVWRLQRKVATIVNISAG